MITKEKISEMGKQLAITHWGYIRDLLKAHNTDSSVLTKVQFHYITAFVHGYKHAWEDLVDLKYIKTVKQKENKISENK